MEGKKISFGFMKTKKVDKPLATNNEEKREYIECVEEKSIKVVGGEAVETEKPLVIPMKPNTLVTAERLKEIAVKVESALEEPEIKQEPFDTAPQDTPTENETLDQMAVRELMQEAKKEVKTEAPVMAIPTKDKTVIDGEKESTLDDYEAVPIQQFGMAMLRGMGWTPGKDGSKYKLPELRPKGLGLGADKVIKENKKKQASKDSQAEELAIVKNSFVKILNGKYSGYYGKVVSLDEDNGRVMVEIPVKKETVSLSEFMMQAVSKSEYDKESKVINADSYEKYKKEENSQNSSKPEDKSSSSQRRDEKEKDRREEKEKERKDKEKEIENNEYRRQRDQDSANGRSRNRRRDSSSSEERSSRRKKKDKKRYSSSDSLSSLSEDDRRHKHSKHKSRRRRSRSGSRKRSPTPEGKRDIDKKRKGKKKKRDRDRSPNYKKHRK